GGIGVLIGNGDGTFMPPVGYPTGSGPRAIATLDYDGDGKPDLAVVNTTVENISILKGVGDGTFAAAATLFAGMQPDTIATGDFNGDGRADLAIGNFTNNNLMIFMNTGLPASPFSNVGSVQVGANPDGLTTGDFNGDGKVDLASANYGSNDTTIL